MPDELRSGAMTAGSVTIGGDGGDEIEAYLARPDTPPSAGPSARVAVELTPASARSLITAIQQALDSAPAAMTG